MTCYAVKQCFISGPIGDSTELFCKHLTHLHIGIGHVVFFFSIPVSLRMSSKSTIHIDFKERVCQALYPLDVAGGAVSRNVNRCTHLPACFEKVRVKAIYIFTGPQAQPEGDSFWN